MSGKDETYILSRMPYARALQYQNEWLLVHKRIPTLKLNQSKGSKTIL